MYHLVLPSPWPLVISLNLLNLLVGSLYFWHLGSTYLFWISLLFLVFSIILWVLDSNLESCSGLHSKLVLRGFSTGVLLFISREIMFFFSFFWILFENILRSEILVGKQFPNFRSKDILIDPFSVPLLKTVLLLSSAVSVTVTHHRVVEKEINSFLYLSLTIFLGVIFILCQIFEYQESYFRFKSSVYGSTFFLLTGFHGLHVFLGLCGLRFCLFIFKTLTPLQHSSLEGSIWYWHFVDVVWLFLYVFLYWFIS